MRIVPRFDASFFFRVISPGLLFGMLMASAVPESTSAISVELAKKCREMAIKAHPTKRPGSATGSAQPQRDYYRDCIAKEGKMNN